MVPPGLRPAALTSAILLARCPRERGAPETRSPRLINSLPRNVGSRSRLIWKVGIRTRGFSQSQPGENAMKTITLLLGACALVALPVATAGAGPCTTEIDNVTKLLASKDAGAAPTAGGASATTGQHPPATMGAADPSTAASSAAA